MEPRVVDKNGMEIKLTSHQKNEIYRRAKDMKTQLADKLCTKRECSKATPERVDKMLNSEFKARQQTEVFVKSMQAIGADPRDCDIERLRRR